MHEEDRAPVTLTETYHQADACKRPVEPAEGRSRIFDKFLPLENYTDIVITGCGSSRHLAMCASFAFSEMLKDRLSRLRLLSWHTFARLSFDTDRGRR